MVNMELVWHALLFGALLSALLGALILGSMAYNAELWLNDYPPQVRERYGPASERTRRQRKWVGIPFFAILLAVSIAAGVTLESRTAIQPTFIALFLTFYLVFLTFNLFDLLVIDLLIGMVLQPAFMVLPGTQGIPAYRDVGFHLVAFLKGALGGLLVAAIPAGVLSLLL